MKDSRKAGVPSKQKRCSYELGKSSSRSFNQFFRALDPIKAVVNFPKHSTLFEEGLFPDGIYILVQGKVKLSVDLKGGRTLILGIAQPGDVLGLSAIMSGKPAEFTAETLTPAQFSHVERKEFLRLLEEHCELCVLVVEVLSHQLREAVEMIHYSSGSQPAAEKLAALLLSWMTADGEVTGQGVELKLPLTQEEIGQMIGVSRETVSRLLAGLEKDEILSLDGSLLRVLKKEALEAVAKPEDALAQRAKAGQKVEVLVPDGTRNTSAGQRQAEAVIKAPK
ncbi:MAG TPA: Crp/Fnr family transcriptional regulator [Terriglobia bacterium]|nr:Crp/Fnr family transcriptional regulator [Terriglobia bacterium]